MTLKEFLDKLQYNAFIAIFLAWPTKEFRIELFDQDNWQYEIEGVEICPTTKRIIFNLKLVGEKEDDEVCNNRQ